VHEAYLKMMQGAALPPADRGHFFSTAARAMRQILVDRARRRNAQKRGAGAGTELLDEERVGTGASAEEILGVDRALERLEELDPRLVRLVELRFYAGLSVEETAEALAVSERTVKRDWRRARAFLFEQLSGVPKI
jgi:RNA polymerase sigma factor (TIGR02999 family)